MLAWLWLRCDKQLRLVALQKERLTTMLVIAHRGASGHAPENTVAAFKRAVTLDASYIETHLQL